MARSAGSQQAPLKIVYWSPTRGARSPVRQAINKMHRDVVVAFDKKIEKLAADPGNLPGVKPLRHVSRLGEIKVDGPHGYHRFILRVEGNYVIVLDAFKKQGNNTPTDTAAARWKAWQKRLTAGDV